MPVSFEVPSPRGPRQPGQFSPLVTSAGHAGERRRRRVKRERKTPFLPFIGQRPPRESVCQLGVLSMIRASRATVTRKPAARRRRGSPRNTRNTRKKDRRRTKVSKARQNRDIEAGKLSVLPSPTSTLRFFFPFIVLLPLLSFFRVFRVFRGDLFSVFRGGPLLGSKGRLLLAV